MFFPWPFQFFLLQMSHLTDILNLLKANSNSIKAIPNPMRKLSTKAAVCAAIYRIIYTKQRHSRLVVSTRSIKQLNVNKLHIQHGISLKQTSQLLSYTRYFCPWLLVRAKVV